MVGPTVLVRVGSTVVVLVEYSDAAPTQADAERSAVLPSADGRPRSSNGAVSKGGPC